MRIMIDIPDTGLERQSFFSYEDPCKGCPNNPRNNPNASGVCNCALPYMSGKQRITCDTAVMRDATIEENASVNKYIHSISTGTGKNFYECITTATTGKTISVSPTEWYGEACIN